MDINKLKRIKLLLLDVDGVLTNGSIMVPSSITITVLKLKYLM